jgi:hypothetical protein
MVGTLDHYQYVALIARTQTHLLSDWQGRASKSRIDISDVMSVKRFAVPQSMAGHRCDRCFCEQLGLPPWAELVARMFASFTTRQSDLFKPQHD